MMVVLDMEEITIKYWSPHGRQEETKFQCGHTKIDLIMRAAQRVDLSNVARCYDLEKLDLSHNMLEELDLFPISGCPEIKAINLQSNHLTKLDLWPLRGCLKLEFIDVSENRLHGLDLTPVYLKTRIRMDSSVVVTADNILRYIYTKDELVKQFQLVRPDGANWSAPPVVIWNTYDELKKRYDWAHLRERIDTALQRMTPMHWYGAQRGLLQGLGISEIAGYDGHPRMLLDNTVMKMSYEEARQVIFDTTVKLLEDQILSDGPTLFLDIGKMKDTSASKLIPLIVDKRKEEVENTPILIKGSKVFLKPLWLTHYGFKILTANEMGMTTDLEGLESIRGSFDELDIEIATEKTTDVKDISVTTASKGMQTHIFNLVHCAFD